MATDFQRILADLQNWGLTDDEMSKRTGIERSRIGKLRRGDRERQPPYDDGCAIVAIYEQYANGGVAEPKSEHAVLPSETVWRLEHLISDQYSVDGKAFWSVVRDKDYNNLKQATKAFNSVAKKWPKGSLRLVAVSTTPLAVNSGKARGGVKA